jgi:hypothetical protein
MPTPHLNGKEVTGCHHFPVCFEKIRPRSPRLTARSSVLRLAAKFGYRVLGGQTAYPRNHALFNPRPQLVACAAIHALFALRHRSK